MNEARIAQLIDKIISEKLRSANEIRSDACFIGYNPLEKIRDGLFHWIAVPFNGARVFCQLRCPNATQIEQCGDISNIVAERSKENKYTAEDIVTIRNYQEALCKLVLNKPTFDEIMRLVGDNDFVISQKKKELENITTVIKENAATLTTIERTTLETEAKTIELLLGFILPDDTMAFLTNWAMGNDVSDIKKISKEMFLRAAALANAHNKAPTDYLSGLYTDYNKVEIDAYATHVYNEYLNEQRIVKGGKGKGFKWILGGRHG